MKYLLVYFIISFPLQAQNIFPLEVGNTWQYKTKIFRNGQPYYVYGWTEWVDRDTIMPNGKKYAFIKKDNGGTKILRQDGSKILSFFNSDSDQVKYDFSKTSGDTIGFIPSLTDTQYCTITTDDFVTIYSQSKHRQWYEYKYLHLTEPQYTEVIDGFGIRSVINGPFPPYELTGAIINGSQYGEATSVNTKNDNIYPASVSLDQNYPNPFNSTTSIKFNLPKEEHVSLKILNVLGQEISLLAEGVFSSGVHVIQWNATKTSSGIYYYILKTLSRTQIKKMSLIK